MPRRYSSKHRSSKRRHSRRGRKRSPNRRRQLSAKSLGFGFFPLHGQGLRNVQRQKRKFSKKSGYGKRRSGLKLNPWF